MSGGRQENMTSVDFTKHRDSRTNNPTMENRNFSVKEEAAPYDTLYPRDPSLDPQLVWKGKDEQDREDLAVPTVPIYIQEKIQPAAIIEDLRAPASRAPARSTAESLTFDLWGDFNGIDSFEKEIEFYQHDKH